MEALKKARAPLRGNVTKCIQALEEELAKAQADENLIEAKLIRLENHHAKVRELDDKIQTKLLDDGATEDEIVEEGTAIEEYEEKFELIRIKIRKFLQPQDRSQSPSGSSVTSFDTAHSTGRKQNFKLPKIELKKFNGDPREWLGFWALFEKIHEDEDISPADKFQYLVQSMVKGSRAEAVVESYPKSTENYEKAVTALKERFGREDLLIEVYIRDLIKMIVSQISGNEKAKLAVFYDKIETQLRALESLGLSSNGCRALLLPLIESCLPEEILLAWQRSPSFQTQAAGVNKLEALMSFIRSEVQAQEKVKLARSGFAQPKVPAKKKEDYDVPTAAGLFSGESERSKCVFCEKGHESKDCFTAAKLSLPDKRSKLESARCCFVCFRKGHGAKNCKAAVRCLICQRKHQSIMCHDLPHHRGSQDQKDQVQMSMGNQTCSKEVVLQTVMVRLVGKNKSKLARAIIDSGSQRSYVLKKTAHELDYEELDSFKIAHALFGGTQKVQDHKKFKAVMEHVNGKFRCDFDVLDEEEICGRIARVPQGPWLQELKTIGIIPSDIGETSQEIEVLIGADVYGKLLTGKVHDFSHGLTAVETRLGWTLLGKVPKEDCYSSSTMLVTSMMVRDSDASDLWNLDVIGIQDPVEVKSRAEQEQEAKDHFLSTVTFNSEGRYEVCLPWVNGQQQLPSNKEVAYKRLQNSTKKLESIGRVADYQAVFDEWMAEGIIEKVVDQDGCRPCHYLPHRPVFKESSSTTKVRPVFDASCKVKGFPSLNDCLQKGPNLMELIPSILLRFREKKIGVTSDIRKAFLQISVTEKDRDFLQFLWWEDNKPIVYRHKRVVFGVNCSPFLLAAVIQFHLEGAPDNLKACAMKLLDSLYVDNCVASFDTQEECNMFMQESTKLMQSAAMDLRMWERSGEIHDGQKITDVLGLKWDKELDTLCCSIDVDRLLVDKVTKRKILSVTHQVYDPIGFLCPVMVAPKLLLQESWTLKCGWDEELPAEITAKFNIWVQDMTNFNSIKVPRCITGSMTQNRPAHELEARIGSETCKWVGRSLHTFVDASRDVYAAVVFLRVECQEGVSVQLLQAKSRIAPVKRPTIPRMELIAATIGSRLAASVKEALRLEGIPEFYWSDSTTVIAWIANNDVWGTFVGNRVKEIRQLTGQDAWRHVPGIMNPADLPSRGCSVTKLLQLSWWEGPEWLKLEDSCWPADASEPNWQEVEAEKKKTAVVMTNIEMPEPWYCVRFSMYQRNLKVVGWVLRFIGKASRRSAEQSRILKVEEMEAAELVLLKAVQEESFEPKVSIINGIKVNKNEDGLYRVETKIFLRDDSYNFRCPIILPSQHAVVDMIIMDVHLKNSHAGMNTMLTKLRENYWIISSRKRIRNIILKCGRCRIYEVKSACADPAPLPLDRIRDSRVFEVTGVDLCGPFYVKVSEDEGTRMQKVWMVLYTCAVYRAVHLELVTALSTERFLMALRRFVDRRGRPATIYSDNGTNFVGSFNELKNVDWSQIHKFCTTQRITWKFNPPTAAWWGGWWERLIGLTKKLFLRVLGRATLDFEELMTVVCDVEAVINSRPLTYVSEQPDDLTPLSPAMFLQEIIETGVPDLDAVDSKGLNKRFRYRQKIRDELRSRFRREYLSQLVQRVKESRIPTELKVGDVVLIGADNKKRFDWPMGRILELIAGKDDKIRVAKLKTASGFLVRPVQRLFPLEVGQEFVPPEVIMKKKQKKVPAPFVPEEKAVEHEVSTRVGRVVRKPARFSC